MTCHERRSLFLSAGAFVLSACALLNSVNHTASAPSIVSEAPPLEKPLAASDGYVRLQQLAVEQANLVGGAVGTLELADKAVTGSKIADGSIPISKLNGEAIASIARTVAQSDKVVGEVDESANVVRGTGFTAALVSPGEYAVTFSTPFLAPPVVVAVAQQYAICYLPSQTLGLHEVRIKCMSDLLGTAPSAVNTRFSFYAAPAV